MNEPREVDALRERVAALESRNRELEAAGNGGGSDRVGSKRGRLRAVGAIALIAIGALLAPVAVIGSWARAELVDTDRFVETFAPVVTRPAVQDYISAQAEQAIAQHVDVEGLVGDLLGGVEQLDLPPKAKAALPLLKAPAVAGVESLISTAVDRVVRSPEFARVWSTALRETHSRAIAVIQDDPSSAVRLGDDGTLSLQLDSVVAEVKRSLQQQGFGFASAIPEVHRSIPLAASDSLALVRIVYQLATAAGTWLPWLSLGLLALGVLVARGRLRAIAWAGAALAASLLLLVSGLGIGRQFFIGSVSPSIMPAATADALFEQLTLVMRSSLLALVALAICIAAGAWISGGSRIAVAARSAGATGFGALRAVRDRAGLDPRGFGRAVERRRPAILSLVAALGVLLVFLSRPASFAGVVWTLVAVLATALVVELLRQPGDRPTPTEMSENRESGAPAAATMEE
ncbi:MULTISPECIES: hypothetical protein [unclassified Leucobacter]|uniref:hypothetical protein n=1 Tax=unclassified Leucobacter TaxID=2621730 RepID=UPI000621ED32|nr:hypothetical protein [Leucobacter sp. Ag1]KKI20696.1 hypothetical protein XM48_07180 [Leucobacter sp. Ag1]